MPPALSLCQRSSFAAENTRIIVIPNFSHSGPLPLLSSPNQMAAGPFVAGMPAKVPLWMAKLLHQKQLAQIQLPDWLAVENLAAVLEEEKSSELLTNQLPFYYYEVARSLVAVLDGPGSHQKGGSPKALLVLLQDILSIRVDKIRQNFHSLSKDTMENNTEELNMIAVTGIASAELNKVGPFLLKAFSDYGALVQESNDDKEDAMPQKTVDAGSSSKQSITATQESADKVTLAQSRLRRFRQ